MVARLKVVLDSNIIISALIYGGKPQKIIDLVLEEKIIAYTSQILIAELVDILIKKFHFTAERLQETEKYINEEWLFTLPKVSINILKDIPDNRVLEAAVQSGSQYIITGDKALLNLKNYKKIQIVSPAEFVKLDTKEAKNTKRLKES